MNVREFWRKYNTTLEAIIEADIKMTNERHTHCDSLLKHRAVFEMRCISKTGIDASTKLNRRQLRIVEENILRGSSMTLKGFTILSYVSNSWHPLISIVATMSSLNAAGCNLSKRVW